MNRSVPDIQRNPSVEEKVVMRSWIGAISSFGSLLHGSAESCSFFTALILIAAKRGQIERELSQDRKFVCMARH